MKELFKSYFKRLFTDKKPFLFLFVFVLFLFSSVLSGFSVFDQLRGVERENGRIVDREDLYYEYKSKAKDDSNDTNGISPLKVFTDEVVNENGYNLPTVSLIDGVVFSYNRQSVMKMVEKIFTTEKEGFNIFAFVKNNVSDDFKSVFSHTKIYNEINNYFNYFVLYWKNKDLTISNIVDKLFDNVFSAKKNNERLSIKYINSSSGIKIAPSGEAELYEKGINSIGQILNKYIDDQLMGSIYFYAPLNNPIVPTDQSVFETLDEQTSSSALGGLVDSELYDQAWMTTKLAGEYYDLDFYSVYVDELAHRYNFETSYLNQFIYSNFKTNIKILLMDRTEHFITNKNYNATSVIYTEHDNSMNVEYPNAVILSNRYAKRNNVKIGDKLEFDISSGYRPEFNVAGIGYNPNNIYPVIFDTDYFPNTKNEMILYINSKTLQKVSTGQETIQSEYITDKSRIQFKYNGNNYENDAKELSKYFSTNMRNTIAPQILSKNDGITSNLKVSAISYLKKGFLIAFSIIFVIIFVTIISSIFIFVIREVNARMDQIGILKANGYRSFEISFEYGLKVSIPSLIAGLISYPLLIGIQQIFIKIVQPYFDIDFGVNFFAVWWAVVVLMFTFLTFVVGILIAQFKIRKRVQDLIEKKDISKTTIMMKMIDKMKIKSYGTRFALKQQAVSFKKMMVLSVVLFISTFAMSFLLSTPNEIKKIKNEYYSAYNYNLSNSYPTQTVNNPLDTYYTYADPTTSESIFPCAYKQDGDEKPFLVNEANQTNYDYVANTLMFTFLSLQNKHFSVGAIDSILNMYPQNVQNIIERNILSQLVDVVLPGVFGLNNVGSANDWRSDLSVLVAKKMPVELLQYWNDIDYRNKFSFDLSSTNFDGRTDEKTTSLSGKIGHSDIEIVGLNRQQSGINVSLDNLSPNDVVISKKIAIQDNLSKGDQLDIDFDISQLSFNGINGYVPIERSQFVYLNDDNTFTPLDDLDLSKFSYEDVTNGVGSGTGYFKVESNDRDPNKKNDVILTDGNTYRPFYKMKNIVLQLNRNEINLSEWTGNAFGDKNHQGLFGDNGSYIENINGKDFVRLYDWKYSINPINDMHDYSQVSADMPTTWFDAAEKNKDENVGSFIKITKKHVTKKVNVKKIVNIYDKNLILTTRQNVNRNYIGYDEKVSSEYFNGIISTNPDQKDILLRVGLMNLGGNYTLNGLGTIQTQPRTSDLLLNKLEVVNEVYNLSLELALSFIIITIAVALISIGMIISQFIIQFAKTIYNLKIMGYSNREIHSMMFKIILPFVTIAVILGAIIPQIVFISITHIAISMGYVIPIIISWEYGLLSITIALLIILGIYSFTYKNIISKNLQQNILL